MASPFGTYAPTVPTTPTSSDNGHSLPPKNKPLPFPVIPPPPFEHIPRAPLSAEEAAERRISILLTRERELRDADGVQSSQKHSAKRTEDEEERFWEEHESVENYEDEDENSVLRKDRSSPYTRRAPICHSQIHLDISDDMLEEVITWFLEVSPALPVLLTDLIRRAGNANGRPQDSVFSRRPV